MYGMRLTTNQLFLTEKWLAMDNTTELYTPIHCFPDRLQEPWEFHWRVICRYMVLKYTPSLPLFDERFVNYGYNKIQYMEQLRYYCIANSLVNNQ